MKLAFLFFLILFAKTSLVAQPLDCIRTIDSLLKTSIKNISADKKKEIRPCIYEIQTEGFYLDEQKCKYDSSKIKIEKALAVWQHLNDTPNQANLLKYLGYLNGRLGYFDSGKIQISKAIDLYRSKNIDYGVAVSWFDLSRIYEYENKIDSAIFFITKALHYWKQQNNAGRIVGLNNNLINLIIKAEKSKDINPLIMENSLYLLKEKIYWQDELDYYFITSEYFKKTGDKEKKDKFLSLYSIKMSALKEETGQNEYSRFDKRNCR